MLRLLHLDPEHLAERLRDAPVLAAPPSLAGSLLHGGGGFACVAIAGFAPWALAGDWLHHAVGEAGMYAACAGVFIALSGPVLHLLVIGPGALLRFSLLFAITYAVYAALWIAAWMKLHGNLGSIVGLSSGCLAMGWMLCWAFAARGALVRVVAALLAGNLIGYYGGGYAEALIAGLSPPAPTAIALEKANPTAWAMLAWGACYGLGIGCGLGAALYWCQDAQRALSSRVAAERKRASAVSP